SLETRAPGESIIAPGAWSARGSSVIGAPQKKKCCAGQRHAPPAARRRLSARVEPRRVPSRDARRAWPSQKQMLVSRGGDVKATWAFRFRSVPHFVRTVPPDRTTLKNLVRQSHEGAFRHTAIIG